MKLTVHLFEVRSIQSLEIHEFTNQINHCDIYKQLLLRSFIDGCGFELFPSFMTHSMIIFQLFFFSF